MRSRSHLPTFFSDVFVGRLGQRFPEAFLVELSALVLLAVLMRLLTPQLAKTLEPRPGELAGSYGGDHRATRFGLVCAVTEPAARRPC